ncbi:MAG: ATP-dependent metallopeptidase FtsH/Yme1/Tma family protein [Dehalococcoidia bacterium]|nr:ATP-dependent metallopeptidase FtsH/Yme1/Tma family protein [Dehalococcoidia bacterium]
MDPKRLRNGFIYLLAGVALLAVFYTLFLPAQPGRDVDVTEMLAKARNNEVQRIEVQGDTLTVHLNSGDKVRTRKETGANVLDVLRLGGVDLSKTNIQVVVKEPNQFGVVLSLFANIFPVILIAGLLLFMMRQTQGTNNQALSFGKSRARMFSGNRPTVTFSDVAGVDEAKQELQEVVEFLKYPEKFSALGARIPRGVLLVGPPGTGKTLLSRAVAGEAGVPFFSISGSEFVEMFVGVGASRVRDLFEQAKKNSPCIVFVDEIDAVGRQRGSGLGGSHDEREQTLNQILVEMDGFDTNTNVIVIAATNRPDVLDPALLRPGRFDRQVVLDRPDIVGRTNILQVHTKGKPLDADIELGVLAKQTPGFTGADLANMVNEAAILAARRNKTAIGSSELEEAVDRVVAGPERKSRIISPWEKELTAYHEGGHALVGRMLPHADPVHKISIVARGMMGGYTRFLPEEDRYTWTKTQFRDQLATLMGGLVAEKLVFGESTTGPGNDIERATNIARTMVTRYGMSEKLGPRTFGRKEELVFLGREISEQRNYSEKIAEDIDTEVQDFLADAYQRAEEILTIHRGKLDRLAERLIAQETLEGQELEQIFRDLPAVGKPRVPQLGAAAAAAATATAEQPVAG